ncbi:MAG: hypothetical protein ABIH21_03025 [Patescibacteria group bacterium]
MGDNIFDDEFENDEDDIFVPEPDSDSGKSSDISKDQLAVKILKQVHQSIGCVLELLESGNTSSATSCLTDLVTSRHEISSQAEQNGEIIEGVFNGVDMVGSDGKLYSVPSNYASKSRLVEGDVLKLTKKPGGDFIFKQIGPVERRRIVGKLAFNAADNSYVVLCGDEVYNTLTASVTYYKGEPGDEVVILVPMSGKCHWAAVENIVKK